MRTVRLLSVSLALTFALFRVTAQEELLYGSGQMILLSGEGWEGEFQWQKDGVALVDDGRIEGAQTTVLRIFPAVYEDTATYWLLNTQTFWTTNLVETNGQYVPVITSTNLVFTNALYTVYVQDPPQILNFYYYTAGDDVSFTVEATGGGLEYQWFWQGQPIAGATSSELKYENAQKTANAGYYSVEVRNRAGTVVTPPPGLLFLKAAPRGDYTGLFFRPHDPDLASSGRIDFRITGAHGQYAGKLNLLGNVYSFAGEFDDQHFTTTTAVPKRGGRPVEISMQLTTLTNAPAFFGTVSDGMWTSPLRGHRLAFNAKEDPTSLGGQYTMAMVNTNLSGPGMVPNGHGFAAFNVGFGGGVKLSGRVADGTPFTHAAGLSSSGEWPLYVVLPKNRGALFGWLELGGGGESGMVAAHSLHWIKPPGPDVYYPGGFNLQLDTIGSPYVGGGVSLPLDEGVAAIAAGDLFSEDLAVWKFYRVWQRDLNKWSAEKSPANLKLSFGSTRGFMTGSFINYMTGLRTPIRGIVLQQQGGVLGYFLSVDSSGYFSITSDAGE